MNRLLIRYTAMGAAYGTAKSGIGISGVGTFRPDLIMKARAYPLYRLITVYTSVLTEDSP